MNIKRKQEHRRSPRAGFWSLSPSSRLIARIHIFLPEGVQEQAKRHLQRTHGINYLEQPAHGPQWRRWCVAQLSPLTRQRGPNIDAGSVHANVHAILMTMTLTVATNPLGRIGARVGQTFLSSNQVEARIAVIVGRIFKTLALAAQGTLSCQDVVTLVLTCLAMRIMIASNSCVIRWGPIPELPRVERVR